PQSERMSVALRLPLGPSRPVTEPDATSQLSPGRTITPRRVTRRFSMRIAGSVATTETKNERATGHTSFPYRARRDCHSLGSGKSAKATQEYLTAATNP